MKEGELPIAPIPSMGWPYPGSVLVAHQRQIPDGGDSCEHTENRTRVRPRRFDLTAAS